MLNRARGSYDLCGEMYFRIAFSLLLFAALVEAQTTVNTGYCIHSNDGVWPNVQPVHDFAPYLGCACHNGAFSQPGIDYAQCYVSVGSNFYPTFSVLGSHTGNTLSVPNLAFTICGVVGSGSSASTYICPQFLTCLQSSAIWACGCASNTVSVYSSDSNGNQYLSNCGCGSGSPATLSQSWQMINLLNYGSQGNGYDNYYYASPGSFDVSVSGTYNYGCACSSGTQLDGNGNCVIGPPKCDMNGAGLNFQVLHSSTCFCDSASGQSKVTGGMCVSFNAINGVNYPTYQTVLSSRAAGSTFVYTGQTGIEWKICGNAPSGSDGSSSICPDAIFGCTPNSAGNSVCTCPATTVPNKLHDTTLNIVVLNPTLPCTCGTNAQVASSVTLTINSGATWSSGTVTSVTSCSCPAGFVFDSNNNCVCPPTFVLSPDGASCVCPAGMFENSNSVCVQLTPQCNTGGAGLSFQVLNGNNVCVCDSNSWASSQAGGQCEGNFDNTVRYPSYYMNAQPNPPAGYTFQYQDVAGITWVVCGPAASGSYGQGVNICPLGIGICTPGFKNQGFVCACPSFTTPVKVTDNNLPSAPFAVVQSCGCVGTTKPTSTLIYSITAGGTPGEGSWVASKNATAILSCPCNEEFFSSNPHNCACDTTFELPDAQCEPTPWSGIDGSFSCPSSTVCSQIAGQMLLSQSNLVLPTQFNTAQSTYFVYGPNSCNSPGTVTGGPGLAFSYCANAFLPNVTGGCTPQDIHNSYHPENFYLQTSPGVRSQASCLIPIAIDASGASGNNGVKGSPLGTTGNNCGSPLNPLVAQCRWNHFDSTQSDGGASSQALCSGRGSRVLIFLPTGCLSSGCAVGFSTIEGDICNIGLQASDFLVSNNQGCRCDPGFYGQFCGLQCTSSVPAGCDDFGNCCPGTDTKTGQLQNGLSFGWKNAFSFYDQQCGASLSTPGPSTTTTTSTTSTTTTSTTTTSTTPTPTTGTTIPGQTTSTTTPTTIFGQTTSTTVTTTTTTPTTVFGQTTSTTTPHSTSTTTTGTTLPGQTTSTTTVHSTATTTPAQTTSAHTTSGLLATVSASSSTALSTGAIAGLASAGGVVVVGVAVGIYAVFGAAGPAVIGVGGAAPSELIPIAIAAR